MHACIVSRICVQHAKTCGADELQGGRDREAAVQTKIKQVDNRGALIISSCMEIA